VPEQPNDMFIVGDQHQRIYDRRSALSKVGIRITRRSKRLRINYRTPHEIMAWSLMLLDGADGGVDAGGGVEVGAGAAVGEGDDPLNFAGYHSFMRGPTPTIYEARSRADQRKALVKVVTQWIDDGVQSAEIGVAARKTAEVNALYNALDAAGVPVEKLAKCKPRSNGVRVATMHRTKRLEFRCVAIDDVSLGELERNSALAAPPS